MALQFYRRVHASRVTRRRSRWPSRSLSAVCRGRRRAFGTGARLRNHRFFSLAEMNVAIRRLLDALNIRLMRGYGASRADLFATLGRPNLQPLPPEPYVFARFELGSARPRGT